MIKLIVRQYQQSQEAGCAFMQLMSLIRACLFFTAQEELMKIS
jgi:hypothetical protein